MMDDFLRPCSKIAFKAGQRVPRTRSVIVSGEKDVEEEKEEEEEEKEEEEAEMVEEEEGEEKRRKKLRRL